MSVDFDPSKQRWRVRWREDGKQRSRRFATEAEAVAYIAMVFQNYALYDNGRGAAAQQAPAPPRGTAAGGDGIYAYETKAGRRYRFVFRWSDGTPSSRRGFVSRRAAAAARRKVIESVDRREVTVCRENFADFWARFVEDKRPYLTRGSHVDLVTHGRKRLLPFFGAEQLSSIDPERIRDWLALMLELIEADEVSPKTINNARTYLSRGTPGEHNCFPFNAAADGGDAHCAPFSWLRQ